MTLDEIAPWLALVTGVFAITAAASGGWRAWRSWRRTRVTQEAAIALMDVHQARLEATLSQLDELVGTCADGGDRLADSLAELRADAQHLRWVLARIPAERERLGRELLDLVLPTAARDRPAAGGADG